jgi:hypothetical protein
MRLIMFSLMQFYLKTIKLWFQLAITVQATHSAAS